MSHCGQFATNGQAFAPGYFLFVKKHILLVSVCADCKVFCMEGISL